MLSKEDIWIKAAVEHVILNIDYFSSKTKRQITNRDIEPDFMGLSKNGINAFWATFCHLRKEGPRAFKPNTIIKINVTSGNFVPSPNGRWRELLKLYEERGLKEKEFRGVKK